MHVDNYYMPISVHSARADKSAMGTINRPLQLIQLFVNLHHLRPPTKAINLPGRG
jgi:hypothetical protein